VSAGGKGSGRRGRTLSDEEANLWEVVARSVKPLRKNRVKTEAKTKAPPAEKPVVRAQLRIQPDELFTGRSAVPLPPKSKPALSPFDRRTKQKLSRGREAIDARIDLHGMTQSEAHAALLRFIERAAGKRAKIVLVITGKSGVLRRQAPRWLALPDFARHVIGFETAHVGHGGEGPLYVRVRRSRF